MKIFSKENLHFLKNNFQLVYGVVLLILIPAALVINTVIFINNTEQVMDVELQRKASLANSIFSSNVPEMLANTGELQSLVERTVQKNDELYSLDILVPKGEDFEIVASLDENVIGEASKYLYNTLAWRSNEAIAYETTSRALSTEDQTLKSDERFWVIVKPVTDKNGERVAIVSMKISSKVINDLTSQNVTRSLIVLGVTVVVIVLLLLNNMRLFRYALLFKKLKEVDQMKDEFISMASHELRTPITGIRGYLNMILDGSFGKLPKEANEKLQMVSEESGRLHDLVEDLLEVSRITQGRVKLELVAVVVQDIISSVTRTFEQQAKEKGLRLATKVMPDVPQVYTDESRLKQILVNLTGNSIKYTEKGSVTISAELLRGKQDMVKIKVSDTGIGMSAKDREKLFEKFYRVRNEKTDKITGTGLGLWITRELITMMKGEIYVDSIEGTGTQVTVLFPPVKEDKSK